MEYAARIVNHEDGAQQVMYTPNAESKHAYRFRLGRDWPDHAEAVELRKLLEAYWACEEMLPSRVRRAFWRTEYSAWLAWADLALPIIVSGLESLLKTDRHAATAQFVSRVPALAGAVGVDGVTEALCDDVYDARSDWVHGAHVKLFASISEPRNDEADPLPPLQTPAFHAVALCQDVLRAAVRRAIEDPAFGATFKEDRAIRARWPSPRPAVGGTGR